VLPAIAGTPFVERPGSVDAGRTYRDRRAQIKAIRGPRSVRDRAQRTPQIGDTQGPMSRENVDLVRDIYRVFDSDQEALIQMLDPAIEWVSPSDAIEPGARRGRAGVRDAFAATAMAWNDVTHTPQEFHDAGDKVLVAVTFRGHGRSSGMDAERTEFHLWTLRGRAAARFAWYYQRDEALAAAGLGAVSPSCGAA
jgi:ketosteroid isomerase-like protein